MKRQALIPLLLVSLLTAYASYLFHEFGHWLVGTLLGNDMAMSLNGTWPRSGKFLKGFHSLYVNMGGPAFTILQAIIALLIIGHCRSMRVGMFSSFWAWVWHSQTNTRVKVMHNDEIYAGGLLNRALDPGTQPPQIRAFLHAEIALLNEVIKDGMRVLDLGCGTGRHLALLADRLSQGIGVDYEHSYITEAAHQLASAVHVHFVTGDAAAVPISATFDFAICLTNTWGTMANKAAVLKEMRRLAPLPQTRLLSVYAEASVPTRREWYRKLDQVVIEESAEYLMTEGGFISEHFSEARLSRLVGDCSIRQLTDIAYVVTF